MTCPYNNAVVRPIGCGITHIHQVRRSAGLCEDGGCRANETKVDISSGERLDHRRSVCEFMPFNFHMQRRESLLQVAARFEDHQAVALLISDVNDARVALICACEPHHGEKQGEEKYQANGLAHNEKPCL